MKSIIETKVKLKKKSFFPKNTSPTTSFLNTKQKMRSILINHIPNITSTPTFASRYDFVEHHSNNKKQTLTFCLC